MPEIKLDNLKFDFDQMSAADVWDFEAQTDGMDLMTFAQDLKAGKVNEANFLQNLKPIIALVWVVVRQTQPDVTFDEVAQHPMIPLFQSVVAVVGTKPAQLEPLAAKPVRARKPKAAATS